MRTVLLLLPAVLSALVLAAHFLRRGALPAVALCLALLALPAVRRPWAARALQVALALAVVVWTSTLPGLVAARRALGEPWERLAAILGTVALVALAGLLLLETRTLRGWFRRDGGPRSGRAGGGPG